MGGEQQGGCAATAEETARREEKPAELAVRSGSTGSVLSRAIWKRGQTAVQFEPKLRRLVGNY